VPNRRQNNELELALHLPDEQIAIQSIRAGQDQFLCHAHA
jgi:hypothetical protein